MPPEVALRVSDKKEITQPITVPKGYEVDKEKSTFEKIVFKKIECKYPKSVKDIRNRGWYIDSIGGVHNSDYKDINHVSKKEKAKGLLALTQLIELRDACNEIDKEHKSLERHHICRLLGVHATHNKENLLCFYKESTADWFYTQHKELIEQYFKLF